MMIVVPVAAVPYVVQFPAAFIGLPAVFAVFLDRHPQIVFGFVNIAITPFVRPCGQGRANQANDRQQGYAKNSDGTSHFAFSF
jgi:hypothetical protein